MLRPKKVWVTWKPKRKRYEVGVWWHGKAEVFYQYEGVPHLTQEIAELHRGEIEAEIKHKTFDPQKHKKHPASRSLYTISEYAAIWLRDYKLRVRTRDVSAEYARHLERYFELYVNPAIGGLDIREVNTPVVQAFYLELIEKDLDKTYVQNIMGAFRKFLNDAYEAGVIWEPIKFPKYKIRSQTRRWLVENRWLTEEEQDYVLKFVPRTHVPIVTTIFYHGLRLSEARLLRRKNFDVDEKTIYVETLKGGPGRRLYLESKLFRMIRNVPPSISHEYLFHYQGKSYSKTRLWGIIREALNEAGFPHISPSQAGRHSYGSNWIAAGKPLPLVQYELGHSDVRTTQMYTHIKVDDQKRWKRQSSKQLP